MSKTRGYTLMELLTVMSIITILSAAFYPAIRGTFSAAYQFSAGQAIGQMGKALQAYASDFDETYPVAMRTNEDGSLWTWFGTKELNKPIKDGDNILLPYLGKAKPKDPIANYQDYLGDHSGFGYNWQTLGSDYSVTKDFTDFPNCYNPAHVADVQDPDGTIAFATSVFYRAPWLPGGDGGSYDFSFISPPSDWLGNPNIDFRHGGQKTFDATKKIVHSTGNALVLYAGGGMKPLKQGQITDKMFTRSAHQAGASDDQ